MGPSSSRSTSAPRRPWRRRCARPRGGSGATRSRSAASSPRPWRRRWPRSWPSRRHRSRCGPCSEIVTSRGWIAIRSAAPDRPEERPDMPDAPNIVLVHGAWADGSCWSAVIERLQADGLHRHRAAVPPDVARRQRRAAAAGAARAGRADRRRRPLLRRPDHDRARHRRAERRRPGLHRRVRARRGRIDRRAARAGAADRRRSRTCASTSRGSPGCPRTTSSSHFAADVDPVKASVMYAVQQPLSHERSGT